MGATTGAGYGAIWETDKMLSAHRVSYEMFHGPIPEDMEIDHLCRIRQCVRPAHLEVVTHLENMHRADRALGIRSAATHCPRGHPYDEENTFLDRRGKRYCRMCQRRWARDYGRKKRSNAATVDA